MKKKDAIGHIELNQLPGDHLVAKMDYAEMSSLCDALRKEIISKTSEFGGHLSSNLGVVEAVVALHHCFDFSKDRLIFDVGHQSYAHKLLSGRTLDNLRHKGGTSGFQKREESIYDPYEAGHSSTAISAAEAFAISRDEKCQKFDVIAFVGDASIVNGLSFEALNNLATQKSKVIIVLNDNDMSIAAPSGGLGKFFSRISTGSLYNKMKRGYRKVLTRTRAGAKLYSFSRAIKDGIKRKIIPITLFDNLGFTYIGTVDGHNIKALVKAYERAKRSEKSVIIHINTVKGKGYPFAEGDKQGNWHGVGPFDIETGKPKSASNSISWSQFYADMIEKRLLEDTKSYLVVASTQTGSKLNEAMAQFPNQSIDMGIAEEHAMTFSGALALNGFHPIISLYATFLQRTYDEIHHDCARMKAPVTIIVDRAGLVGGDGETHQGIYDVAMLSSIPDVIVAMPSNKTIAEKVFLESYNYQGVTAIRYPKGSVGEVEEDDLPFEPYRYRILNQEDAHDIGVLVVGPKMKQVKDVLKEVGLLDRTDLIDPVYLFPIKSDNIDLLMKYKNLLIYDSYSTENGFANNVLAELFKRHYQGNTMAKAVPNRFMYLASEKELEADLGLTPSQVIDCFAKTLK